MLTWTEVTPGGVVSVSYDGRLYYLNGTIVPAERYQQAIETGVW